MRAVAVALLLPAFVSVATAQTKGPAGPASVHYFDLNGLMEDTAAEATLRETRRGATVTSAVLDVCYPVSQTSARKERFVVNLAPVGSKLTGTGQTQFGKEPVTVELVRSPGADDAVSFETMIKVGPAAYNGTSSDNTSSTEDEYREAHRQDETVTPVPAAFIEQSPGTVAARVSLDAIGTVVKALKSEDARVRLESLQPDCQALRAGSQVVSIEVDPMRSAALVAKLRAVPGVALAGWTSGTYFIDSAVKLSASDFGGANVDKDKLASALAASAAKLLSATVTGTKWDPVSGELSVTLKRPNPSLIGMNLTDEVELMFLVGPDRPGPTDALVVWAGISTITTKDDGPEPRLKVVQVPQGEGAPAGDFIDAGLLLAALARDLSGRTWDGDARAWK